MLTFVLHAIVPAMRRTPIIFFVLLASCDQQSQRIWNCSTKPLEVKTILDNGKSYDDTIGARSYIGSMHGGVQLIALERREAGKIVKIWTRDHVKPDFSSTAEEACGEMINGVAAEQLYDN